MYKRTKKDYKIGLLSNANNGVIERKIPAELRELFDVIVVSAEVGLMKPDPAIYELITQRLGVKPKEAIFIDDHPDYILGAQQAGMQALLYGDLDSLKKDLRPIIKLS